MDQKVIIEKFLEEKRETLCNLSDRIWSYAEICFEEKRSADDIKEVLAEEGFDVTAGIAGMPTAFVGSFGSGSPVIALLGEYDALTGMSQRAGVAVQQELEKGGNGHGCGHHLLGVGALGAALAVKAYLKESGIPGTVRYYGCPAEESGAGKTFMVRAGAFDGVDAALTWHPSTQNAVVSVNLLAALQYRFRFHGVSSHASATPFLGRSALDAVELMNVGANYLREHMAPGEQVHYAITNTGGTSPNVVQSEAEVLYFVRAPKASQALQLANRLSSVAKGAGMMTETQCEIFAEDGLSNLVPNNVLEQTLYSSFERIGIEPFTEEELGVVGEIQKSLSMQEIGFDLMRVKLLSGGTTIYDEYLGAIQAKVVSDLLAPYTPTTVTLPGSTDVGDVSWVVPTAQIMTACSVLGTPEHSWQQVAQGTSSVAHKGMLTAAKVLAGAAVTLLENPQTVAQAKEELQHRLDGEPYVCPMPSTYIPPVKFV